MEDETASSNDSESESEDSDETEVYPSSSVIGRAVEPSPKRGKSLFHIPCTGNTVSCLSIARREHHLTSKHVDVVVKWCCPVWRPMGRVLLRRSDTEVENLVSHLSAPVRFSDKLRFLVEEWQRRRGEDATVSRLLKACGHPDIERRGIVEQKLKKAGLL